MLSLVDLSVWQGEECASRPVSRLEHVSQLFPVDAVEHPGTLELQIALIRFTFSL